MQNKLVDELVKIVGKANVLTAPEDLAVYGYDGTFQEARPEVVVLPESTAQLSEVVKLAATTRTPVVPRGMGSGLAAGSVPMPAGGMVLSMTRMNRILEIDEENATVHAEAGVVTADLQAAVEKRGLFYPPDPSSIRHSTIGGNVACNAGGPRCLKYGVTGDYVLGLTVVLADGRILKSGGKPIKDVTGYDLNGLFTGSEGTLGVVTSVDVALLKREEKVSIIQFLDSDEQAVQLAEAMREQYGLNQPVYVQYFKWMGQILQGNLGVSMEWRRPVWEVIEDRRVSGKPVSLPVGPLRAGFQPR